MDVLYVYCFKSVGSYKYKLSRIESLVILYWGINCKCIVLRIGTLTGCPLCRESHPLCRLKNPTVISIWLLVGFHPATRSVQSTPADNTRKRVWQYIEKESVPISSQNLQNLVSGQPSGKSFGSAKDSNSSVNDSPMSLKS